MLVVEEEQKRGENMDQTPIELPGFRFHPTEEELLDFYLKNMVNDRIMPLDIISFLNIYRFEPWDLPGLAKIGEREWYFFVPRDRKASNGGRPNRTTEHGFWKATGSDRKIFSLSEPKRRSIGLRKTLVFYQGRAPRGTKTDWIMNEYRLPDHYHLHKDIVLCKIYRKATSLKELEQRAAKEEEKSTMPLYPTSPLSSSNDNNHSFLGDYSSGTSSEQFLQDLFPPMPMSSTLKKEEKYVESYCNTTAIIQHNPVKMESNCFNNNNNNNNIINVSSCTTSNTLKLPLGKEGLELQVPKSGLSMSTGTDWAQDPLCAQCSPWLENLLNNFSSPTLISQLL